MKIGDVTEFIHTMERGLIAALADEGVHAEIREGLTGVWVEDRKIGSIGVHIQRGVTTHGWAINIDNDLQPFEWVVPCGIDNVRMTSLSGETGRAGGMGCFRKRAAWRFAEAYGRRQRIVSAERLRVPSVVA
jgi:lipoyl(octanoyl) transferase